MKIVEYKNMQYEAPDWANFIAADGDGSIWCFEYEPEWSNKAQKYNEPLGLTTRAVPVVEAPELKRI